MNKFIEKYLVFVSILAVIIANSASSFAQDKFDFSVNTQNIASPSDFEDTSNSQKSQNNTAQPSNTAPADFEDVSNDARILKENEQFINRLKDELNLSKTDYHQLLNNIDNTKEELNKLTTERVSLEGQVENINSSISQTSARLLAVIKQIIEAENEIALISEEIELKEISVNYQRSLLKDYLQLLYVEENTYFSFDENGEIGAFKLLLSDNSVGENLQDLKYFDLLNETGQQILGKLELLQFELQKEQKILTAKKTKLFELEEQIKYEKIQLETQKESKEKLLQLTLGKEDVYSQLLEQSIVEQNSVADEIRSLSTAIAFIVDEMEKKGLDFNPDNYAELLSEKNKAIYNFHVRYRGLDTDGFEWPVDPDRGISAYFHDPSYVGVFGVQHNAIDIPAYQGTPMRAAADGVVYSTKDNGYGYSYIILMHDDDISTVYGHVNKILVKEGQTVSKGTIIGLVGGQPGTLGAGYMTTGSHLHFEVHLNDSYVDPLEYLPLEILTTAQINSLPDKYHDEWEAAVHHKEEEFILR